MNGLWRHPIARQTGQHRSRRVLCIGGFAETKHCAVFFIPLDDIFGNTGSPPDQQRQDSC